jgi:diguanylate cyclase
MIDIPLQSSDLLHLLSGFCISVFAIYVSTELIFQTRESRGRKREQWFAWSTLSFSVALTSIHVLTSPSAMTVDLVISNLWSLGVSASACILGCALSLYSAAKAKPNKFLILISTIALTIGLATMHFLPVGNYHSQQRIGPTVLIGSATIAVLFVFVVRRASVLMRFPSEVRSLKMLLYGIAFALPACLIHFVSARAEVSSYIVAAADNEPSASQVRWVSITLFAFIVLAFGLLASLVSRQIYRRTLELNLIKERDRVTRALNDQRVIRLQNEALNREIEERHKVEKELMRVAYHDPLTGLYNRAYLSMRFAELVDPANRPSRKKFALLYIDLDRFKSINDALGTTTGDFVLQQLAGRLQRCAREDDIIARVGGDEFGMVLHNLKDVSHAFRVAQRVLDMVEEPFSTGPGLHPVTASIGIREIDFSSTETDHLLRDADTAMRHAKRSGGAQIQVFQRWMRDQALAEMQARFQLQLAVEKQEFSLYYQPLIDARDRSIYGVEALIRWNHPVRGLLSPSNFIKLAESTGHIVSIGAWALRQACLDFALIRSHAKYDFILSVNVSSVQLSEDGFVDSLGEILIETNMPAYLLQLEITESIFMDDARRIGNLFEKVRALGVKIALDDFGTGYSSLSYLERYAIDALKIDQSFVQNMLKGSVNAEIVQLVIQLSQTIGIEVSAEGVEQPSQAEALVSCGCNIMQGYLYSEPVSLNEMVELFHRGIPRRGSQLEVIHARKF